MDRTERLMFAVQINRIDQSGSPMCIVDGDADTLRDRTVDLDDHETAARAFLEWLSVARSRFERCRTPHSGTVDARIRTPHVATTNVPTALHGVGTNRSGS